MKTLLKPNVPYSLIPAFRLVDELAGRGAVTLEEKALLLNAYADLLAVVEGFTCRCNGSSAPPG